MAPKDAASDTPVNSDDVEVKPKNKAKPDAETPDAKTQTTDDLAAFETQLQRLASSKPVISSGKLQVINIEPVASELGDQWRKQRDRLQLKIENVLSKYLGNRDIYRQHKEYIYVIVFADIGGDEAKSMLSVISKEIEKIFFGENEHKENLDLRTATLQEDGNVVLIDINPENAIDSIIDKTVSAKASGDQEVENDAENEIEAINSPAMDKKIEDIKNAHDMSKSRLDQFSEPPKEGDPKAKEYELLHEM